MIELLNIPKTKKLEMVSEKTFQLSVHTVFEKINTLDRAKIYMESQIWCVWDFMMLLRSIQNHYMCQNYLWLPPQDTKVARFIYEMLISEETDIDETGGGYSSHFETYLRAMSDAGADMIPINEFLRHVRKGDTFEELMELKFIPDYAKDFMRNTHEICKGSPESAVAAFCLGRENLIPEMFKVFLRHLEKHQELNTFRWYLMRHVAVDSENHGPQSARLLERVLDNDKKKIEDALDTSVNALESREKFLDQILILVESKNCEK